MFGYVRPRRDELKVREDARYRAAYCGLCRAMARAYGFRTRFLVNYDMTFLYLLRASLEPAAAGRSCWCPARLFGKKRCVCDEAGFSPVTACNIILSYHKILDNIRDSGWFRGVGYRFLKLLFRRPYKKAARIAPEFDRLARQQLDQLNRLEQEKSSSIDATADAFARLTAGCAGDYRDEAVRRPMQAVLYQTGRFIYLCDALDDLKDDLKTDSYNPLRYRFSPGSDGLKTEDLDYLAELMDSSVNLAGAALELLPMKSGEGLLENIIFLGLPAVFQAVRAGRFHARAKENPRKEKHE